MKYKDNPLAVRLYKYLSVAKIPNGHTLELVNSNNNIVIRFSGDGAGQVNCCSDGVKKFFRRGEQPTFEDAFERAYNSGILEPLCPKEWNPYRNDGVVYAHKNCLSLRDTQWIDYADFSKLPDEYQSFVDNMKVDEFADRPKALEIFYAWCFEIDGRWYGCVHLGNEDYWRDFDFFFRLDVLKGKDVKLSHIDVHNDSLVFEVKKQYAFFDLFLEWEMSK